MSELDDSFAKLLGRQPTDAERQRLFGVKDALKLGNNDALWLVLIALEHYKSLYELIPGSIEKVAVNTLLGVKATAEANAKSAMEETKAELAKAVATVAQDVAHKVAGTQQFRWGIGLTVVLIVLMGASFAFGLYMEQVGLRAGRAAGYQEAQDQKAAADWANTAEGQAAYQFARSGNLERLTRCEQPGWWIESNTCYPGPATDGMTYGWSIPQDARKSKPKPIKPKK